jgi:hypothetical protein
MTTAVIVGFLVLLGVMFNDGILLGTYLHEQFRLPPATLAEVHRRVFAAGHLRRRGLQRRNPPTLAARAWPGGGARAGGAGTPCAAARQRVLRALGRTGGRARTYGALTLAWRWPPRDRLLAVRRQSSALFTRSRVPR